MSPLEYFSDSVAEWPTYVSLLAFFISIHIVLIRKWAVGIFDPFFMILVANIFSCAIVWFMYIRGDILEKYVVSFTLCQLAFYIGIFIDKAYPSRSGGSYVWQVQPKNFATLVLTASTVVNFIFTIYTWSLAGIPLFRDSRLGAFEGSGGFGILERLADSSQLIAVFSISYVFFNDPAAKKKIILYLLIFWYAISTALSGSKGAFLTLAQYTISAGFVYSKFRYRNDSFWGGRIGRPFFLLSGIFAVGVLATQNANDLTVALAGFVYRVVSYGDVFVFAYPNGLIENLKGDNAFIGLFGGFFSTFRLFPQDSIYQNIGFQFTGLLFPDLEVLVGPNPQHPVFGYHFFGMAAPLFSLVLGYITSQVQDRFYTLVRPTFLGGLISFMVYISVVGISIDFEYSLTRVASGILGFLVIIVPILALHPYSIRIRYLRRSNIHRSLSSERVPST